MSLTEIKDAIASLRQRERRELQVWLLKLGDDEWDRHMEADARSGKLDVLLSEAREVYRSGEAHSFP